MIPNHNGGEDLRKCLEALTNSTRPPDEIIVIDDASTDESIQIAQRYGAIVLYQKGSPLGPAKARNRGAAAAQGDILIFIDADVKVHRDSLALIERYLFEHPEISALFGSYDDAPPHRSLVSLYKHLQNHHVHQHSKREASTFWTGLGAIRRDVFIRLGGFKETFARPSIEDIELGVRLRQSGHQIWLCSDIQATHLKRWNLLSLLRSDIFDRAVPWTRLILSTSQVPTELNLDVKSRASALIVWSFILFTMLGFWFPIAWIGAALLLGALITLNLPLYHSFIKVGGLGFTVGALGLHMLYFVYSSLTFTFLSTWNFISNLVRPLRPTAGVDGLIEDPSND